MPTVPTYENFQVMPTVQPAQKATAPAIQNTEAEMQRQSGVGLATAGKGVLNYAEEQANFANQARVNDALQGFETTVTGLRTQYGALEQKAALQPDENGVTPIQKFQQDIESARTQVRQTLSNQDQMRLFDRFASSTFIENTKWYSGHMLEQQKKYELGQYKALNDSAINDVKALTDMGPKDMMLVEAAKAKIADNVTRVYGNSLSKEELDSKLSEALTPVHQIVLTNLINQRKTVEASNYFKGNKESMTPQEAVEMSRVLGASERILSMQKKSDEILDQSKGNAVTALQLVKDSGLVGEERDELQKRVMADISTIEAAKKQSAEQMAQSAWTEVFTKGRMSPATATAMKLNAPEQYRQYVDWAEQKARRAKADAEGDSYDNHYGNFYGYVRMAMDDPGKFVNMDLRQAEPYVSKTQLAQLTSMQMGINKNDAKQAELSNMLRTANSVLGTAMNSAGIKKNPKAGTSEAQTADEFNGALVLALTAKQKEKGSALSDEEIKREGMNLLRSYIDQDAGIFAIFKSKTPGYKLLNNAEASGDAEPISRSIVANYSDIPKNIRDQLTEEYLAKYPASKKTSVRGTDSVSDETKKAVERAYTAGVKRGTFEVK